MWTSPRTADAPPPARPPTAEAVLRRLEWTVIRRLDGLLQGDYRTLFRGAGLDLADLREYQHHDDVRYIDWNVTARMQSPYVREFQEDREIAAWFLVDLSGSVDFGSTTIRKRDMAIDRRSTQIAYFVLMGLTLYVGGYLPFVTRGWEIVNSAIASVVIAELVRCIVAVVAYRRSAA